MKFLFKIKFIICGLWHALLLVLPEEFSKYRVSNYNNRGCEIHKTVWIAANVRIKGKVKIGKGSSIAQNCTLSGENVGIFIGENVMIAPNVVLVAFSHGTSDNDVPMSFQKNIEASIIIEDDVWISSNCTIGKGVTIGKGSIVGANSFVNKDISAYSIVGGVPAKVIKKRDL